MNREDFVKSMRRHIGKKFGHQGRGERLDCGGLILVGGRQHGLTELEELGYASFPTNGRFEELLREHTDFLGWESKFPHKFDGTELLPGDLISFDYENGEGTRHIALVTKFDGLRYWILDATPNYGVSEHPLGHPFSKATLKGWRIQGLEG